MRETAKIISVSIEGKHADIRLTKLDAFSGAALLRTLRAL